MFPSSPSQPCRCRLHRALEVRRHASYRQLAQAILGPAAPGDDLALARALAEHAAGLSNADSVTTLRTPRAA